MYMSLSTAILSHFHTEARAECFSSGFNYQLPDKLSTFFFLEWPYLAHPILSLPPVFCSGESKVSIVDLDLQL